MAKTRADKAIGTKQQHIIGLRKDDGDLSIRTAIGMAKCIRKRLYRLALREVMVY